jgi:hypothetical protein
MSEHHLDPFRLWVLQQEARALTEREWLRSSTPFKMLPLRRENANNRRLRLFALACCRRIRHLLNDPRSWHALGVLEAYVERQAGKEDLAEAAAEAREASEAAGGYGEAEEVVCVAAEPRPGASYWEAAWWVMVTARTAASRPRDFTDHGAWLQAADAEEKAQADLLRCIFGNPFRPPPTLPLQVGGAVVDLAQRMYEARDFTDMPLVADALQAAGCEDKALLTHCRAGGEHVRGCWAVDLVLGKS